MKKSKKTFLHGRNRIDSEELLMLIPRTRQTTTPQRLGDVIKQGTLPPCAASQRNPVRPDAFREH